MPAEFGARFCSTLRNSYRSGGKVLVCGNGGSAADSEHIVGELMKGYLLPRAIHGQRTRNYARLTP
jgi:D-sedoheptulose 7-phosphate isomerase